MIRMSKLTDYGIVLMTRLAEHSQAGENCSARDLARETGLPLPVVSKILKLLSKNRLLKSQRGANGGYSLARSATDISVSEVIGAMEGPIAVTECMDTPGDCRQEPVCPVRHNWRKINNAISSVLDAITVADMLEPLPDSLVTLTGLEIPLDGSKLTGGSASSLTA
ncbi:MAG TPA: SUF system Fe-S cluster assembly regulator [Acidobacteriota bacterium]|nr:SUF system Fe-S cluster assembly regulator [Acidobacteriota bacterium]